MGTHLDGPRVATPGLRGHTTVLWGLTECSGDRLGGEGGREGCRKGCRKGGVEGGKGWREVDLFLAVES